MAEPRYTEQDLQILDDALEFIRRRTEIFVPFGLVSADVLATRLAADICSLSQQAVAILQRDLWWVVAGEEDWIEPFRRGWARQSRSEWSLQDYFTHLVPFPEYGVNCVHSEAVLTAFSQCLVTEI